MQPYFFPYAQQLRFLGQCDVWIIFDLPRIARKTWVTRNRILNREKAETYIWLDLHREDQGKPIFEARLGSIDWAPRLRRQLGIYRKHAAYFEETMNFLETLPIEGVSTISRLNSLILRATARYLGLGTTILEASEIGFDLSKCADPGDFGLEFSRQMGATSYLNAPGGRHLFQPNKFAEHGIKLQFYQAMPLVYSTKPFLFIEDLSVLDSLMWLGRAGLSEWAKSTSSIELLTS